MENYLIDTNVLIYAINQDSEFYLASNKLLEKALNSDLNYYTSINNLLEFYAISTDKKRTQNPLSPTQAQEVISIISESQINILNTDIQSLNLAIQLAVDNQQSKQIIFDYLIASIMINNNITNIISYNTKDFKNIKQIRILKPDEVE